MKISSYRVECIVLYVVPYREGYDTLPHQVLHLKISYITSLPSPIPLRVPLIHPIIFERKPANPFFFIGHSGLCSGYSELYLIRHCTKTWSQAQITRSHGWFAETLGWYRTVHNCRLPAALHRPNAIFWL